MDVVKQPISHALITPKLMSGSNREIVEDYVEKQMLAHHFSHSYSRRCRRIVLQAAGVISPSCPITPKLLPGSSRETAGGYVEKQMLAHHFSHYSITPEDDDRTSRPVSSAPEQWLKLKFVHMWDGVRLTTKSIQ